MRRLSLLFALAALLASASAAHAQTPYVNITEVRITEPGESESDKKPIASPVYINNQECRGTFDFKLSRIATTVSVMEAWATTGSNARCTDPASRSRINNNEPACWLAGTQSGVTGEYVYRLNGPDLFSRNGELGSRECPKDAFEQIFTVYFVPLASSSSSTGAMAPAPIPGVLQPYATFTLSTQQPAPPNNVTAHDGQREFRVTWDRIATNPRTRYRAFLDYGTAPGRECGSGILDGIADAGARGPMPPMQLPVDLDAATDLPIDASSEQDGSSPDGGDDLDAGSSRDADRSDAGSPTGDAGDPTDDEADDGADDQADDEADDDASGSAADPTRISVPEADWPYILTVTTDTNADNVRFRNIPAELQIGYKAQVAVATIDPTGNVGYLSERSCVERKESRDLIDLCNDNQAECGLESCALSSGRSGSAVGLVFLALALSALIRRRRSA